jgi:hypothetical protein
MSAPFILSEWSSVFLIRFLISVYVEMLMCCESGERIANSACLSVLSLPIIPICPVIQIKILLLFFAPPNLFRICIAISLGLNLYFTLMRELNESLRMIYFWSSFFFIYFMNSSTIIASAVYMEHINGNLKDICALFFYYEYS